MRIQRVRSKWAKTKALRAEADMHRFLPETRRFNRQSVRSMLDRLGMIYVKPVSGTFGKGVIRVEKRTGAHSPYFFQCGTRKYKYGSFSDMYGKLIAVKRRGPYLAQRGIELLKYRGRRFDLRVMVQKNPRSRWETTGLIGRLAHPRKIVTNYHSGGTPMTITTLLGANMPLEQLTAYRRGLKKLGARTAAVLQRKFPYLKEIGVDIAIDENRKPWILEVNTLPDPYLFRKLPDTSVFRKIYRYAQAYGRFRRKRRLRR